MQPSCQTCSSDAGLKCTLYPYQRRALAWLMWREQRAWISNTLNPTAAAPDSGGGHATCSVTAGNTAAASLDTPGGKSADTQAAEAADVTGAAEAAEVDPGASELSRLEALDATWQQWQLAGDGRPCFVDLVAGATSSAWDGFSADTMSDLHPQMTLSPGACGILHPAPYTEMKKHGQQPAQRRPRPQPCFQGASSAALQVWDSMPRAPTAALRAGRVPGCFRQQGDNSETHGPRAHTSVPRGAGAFSRSAPARRQPTTPGGILAEEMGLVRPQSH